MQNDQKIKKKNSREALKNFQELFGRSAEVRYGKVLYYWMDRAEIGVLR